MSEIEPVDDTREGGETKEVYLEEWHNLHDELYAKDVEIARLKEQLKFAHTWIHQERGI